LAVVPPQTTDNTAGPTVPWLALGFLLAGLGTVLLGPLLPTLAHTWSLTDAESGRLLAAKFVGAFVGGVSVPRRLRLGILGGTLLCAVGFGAFAVSPGFVSGAASLFVSGLGLGQIIASTNILAGRRYRSHTGSALASLNFFWAFGAVICGVIAAIVLPRFGYRDPLLSFAGLFLFTGLGGLLGQYREAVPDASEEASAPTRLPRAIFVHFSLLLFLYGGLETCMTGWLTTYTFASRTFACSVGSPPSCYFGPRSPLGASWPPLLCASIPSAPCNASVWHFRRCVLQRWSAQLTARSCRLTAFSSGSLWPPSSRRPSRC
jgi:FHS family glucose/mannose:H+ symporter-like MFS transporter